VRGANGREVPLETWERFAEADPLTPRAVEQMVLGVSTRNYARSIESAPPHMSTRGTSKSAVSRRFVAATREKLSEMMSRDLSGLAICATMIDGIHMGEHLVLVALGIDEGGEKHVLGLYEGATENETVCTALISDLASRGLRADRSMLFVIDGRRACRSRSARSTASAQSSRGARSTSGATSWTTCPRTRARTSAARSRRRTSATTPLGPSACSKRSPVSSNASIHRRPPRSARASTRRSW
jgi:hypothetical protein